MGTHSIRPGKLADAIADHLRRLIVEGALQPGERLLSERDLSAKLDVSRPSLRDGLAKLVGSGLLAADAQGVYVSEQIGRTLRDPLRQLVDDPAARLDFIEFRLVNESAAAAYAAERASEIDRQLLATRFDTMVEAHARADVDGIAGSDADFHLAIYEASHNLVLLHVMQSLESLVRSSVYLNRKNLFEYREAPDSQLAEHRAIFDAVMARQADRAAEAARAHMVSTLEVQRRIQEMERRLESSSRRLTHRDLVAPPK